jgi:NAD(P)H-quinone oxidoreductase subunit 5
VILAIVGNVNLDELGAATSELRSRSLLGLDAATASSLLIAIAALARCAQVPFSAWLTQTLAAPTPVSAMLHAGIVNAGGLLLIITAPLLTASSEAMLLIFAVAATGMIHATSLMITRADVKGALVLSTRAQMAFMLLQCSVGAFGAAAFHLVAHGMYKAALFLAAGSVVDEQRTLRRAPQPSAPAASGRRALRQGLGATLVPAALIASGVALLAPSLDDDASGLILLAFAWATAAQASWWWLRSRRPSGGSLWLALASLAAAVIAYLALLSGAKEMLAPALPPAGDGAIAPAALIPVIAIAVAATGVRWLASAGALRLRAPRRLDALNRRLYARALSADVWPRAALALPRLRGPAPSSAAAPLGAAVEGVRQ